MCKIFVNNVSKFYDSKPVLRNLSCAFDEGAITCVMGPSGCGKTTLLRIISGLEKPDEGRVTDIGRHAFVFQEDRLIPRLSALENCTLVGIPSERAKEALCGLGLTEALSKPASQLSGGMARRVAIARAMLFDAKTVLLDEPLKGLDEQMRAVTLEFIRAESKEKTLLMVTHAKNEAEALGARVFELTRA